VQVEEHPEPVIPAPGDEAIDERESGFDGAAGGILHDPGVDREAYVIESEVGDRGDVVLGDVALAEPEPEDLGIGCSDETFDEGLDLARRLRARPELPHVPLGKQPVAETDAAEQQPLAVAVDELGALASYEPVEGRRTAHEAADGRLDRRVGHGCSFSGHLRPESAKPCTT
jgi:hypothetical protein